MGEGTWRHYPSEHPADNEDFWGLAETFEAKLSHRSETAATAAAAAQHQDLRQVQQKASDVSQAFLDVC